MMLNWEGVTDTGEDRGLAQKGWGGGDGAGWNGAQGGRKGTRDRDRPGGDGGTDPGNNFVPGWGEGAGVRSWSKGGKGLILGC